MAKVNDKLSVTFKGYYLMGVNERESMKMAVGRRGRKRVRIAFTPGRMPKSGNVDSRVGILQFDDEVYAGWFEGAELDAEFATGLKCAESLLKKDGIFFACPFCGFTARTVKDGQAHVSEHMAGLLREGFDIRVYTKEVE